MAVDLSGLSPRVKFQLAFFAQAPQNRDKPDILNVGCADDPFRFGAAAMHVDVDDWSKRHRHFRQANVERLPFKDKSYHTVILGDVLEHVVDWRKGVRECCRVCAKRFVMTVFEEWRLGSPGQHIEFGQARGDEEARHQGAKDREDWQVQHFPDKVGVNDKAVPHLIHINQFTDADMFEAQAIIESEGLKVIHLLKAQEGQHEGHIWWNWLIMAERESSDGKQTSSQAGQEGPAEEGSADR